MQATFYNPVEIHFARGTAAELPALLTSLRLPNARILMVTDQGLAAQDFVRDIEQALRNSGLTVFPFSDIRAEPRAHEVDAAVALGRKQGVSCVVGIGGGSALDVAKLAACLATVDQPVSGYAFGRKSRPRRLPAFVPHSKYQMPGRDAQNALGREPPSTEDMHAN